MTNIYSQDFILAMVSGFLLFGLDILALGWGAKRLLSGQKQGIGFFAGGLALALKFALLGVGLYVLVVTAKLSVVGVAAGATVCLGCVALLGRGGVLFRNRRDTESV